MFWINLIVLLAILQYMIFSIQVGRARDKYQVSAPATTGHTIFERLYRVQMNTLELLIMFIPMLYITAFYWPPHWMAVIGGLFLMGRIVYRVSYINNPESRVPGFLLSALPIILLWLAALWGVVREFCFAYGWYSPL